MGLYMFGILIVLSLVHNSLQGRCYQCTEYVNRFEGQAPALQSTNITVGTRAYGRLCHNLDPVARPGIVVSCQGEYCVKAVVKLNDAVDEIYRTCAEDLDCDNFQAPKPDATIKFCEKCKGDECNSTSNIAASLFLISLSSFALLKKF